MPYRPQSHTVRIVIGGTLVLGSLTGCGSGEPSTATPKQASQTTCAEFMRMSASDQFDAVERAVEGKPGWELKPANGDDPSMALRAATTMAKKNCGQPDAAEKTVADSVYVPQATTVPTP